MCTSLYMLNEYKNKLVDVCQNFSVFVLTLTLLSVFPHVFFKFEPLHSGLTKAVAMQIQRNIVRQCNTPCCPNSCAARANFVFSSLCLFRSEGWALMRPLPSWSSTTRKGQRSWKRFVPPSCHLFMFFFFSKCHPPCYLYTRMNAISLFVSGSCRSSGDGSQESQCRIQVQPVCRWVSVALKDLMEKKTAH